ncbi:alpha/beta hydrolase [Mycolicibacillus parakoreensis]|uniref:Alpha/beta hydrolase n=1 Tax=Mycolicibacillus parakoreensis TaxID=1069221 RepID=A0ABY3U213_9MYCO|nr:alpha/beta hydrolase [Mycolicibacillus parakoreensis]ULN54006.1 alpha/beta hydrolase [Mycolicibacillus parakoreensis]
MTLPAGALSTTPPSWRARACYAAIRRVVAPLLYRYLRDGENAAMGERMVTAGRWVRTASRAQRRRPYARRLDITRDIVDGVVVEMVRAPGCTAGLRDGAILYFHGGGFFVGGLDSHLHVMAILSQRTGLPVVHVEYRQYPDVRVDGSVADCLAAYRWLLGQGTDPQTVVLAGDSAGGFLAFATVLAAQQQSVPTPAGVVGISPLLDIDCAARDGHPNSASDPLIRAAALPLIMERARVLDGVADPSPVNGDLTTFPPSLIIAADSETLRCDAERMHAALTAAGRVAVLKVWTRQVHGFPALFPFLPESKVAFDHVAQFVAERLAAGRAAAA